MACRSRQRADAARAKLLEFFEDDVARFRLKERRRNTADLERRVEAFRANLVVAVHLLDLASVRSTLAFADEVARTSVLSISASVWVLMFFWCEGRYPYVSHLVCNAGVAPFSGISWPLLFRQLWRDMLELNLFGLVTNPSYSVQRRAVMSDDGLGWTWQCNVFGHYILVCTSACFHAHTGTDEKPLLLCVWCHSAGRCRQSLRRRGRDPVASCGCPRSLHIQVLTTQTIGSS